MSLNAEVCGLTADSYVTLGEAEKYFAAVRYAAAWNNEDTAGKESALKQAAREIDIQFRFYGSTFNNEDETANNFQCRSFPRSYHHDTNNNPYIPIHIKQAQCEQALHILTRSNEYVKSPDTHPSPYFSSRAEKYLQEDIDRLLHQRGAYPWFSV